MSRPAARDSRTPGGSPRLGREAWGALAVLGAAVLWGLIGPVANGLSDRGVNPVTMATWRSLIAGVGFAAIWLVRALRARPGSGGVVVA
ncbi:MAG: EamA family transporter, partial [Microthrixaceae bacterium]